MVRYHNFDIVFAEIPCETTLAINITNCPNRCRGCHSLHLQADMGRVLDEAELCGILARYGRSVTCVCFMGGDAAPHEIAALADVVRQKFPVLHTGWYSGRARLPEGLRPQSFDYIKLGGWVEELGPLTSPTTNQRLYRVGKEGAMQKSNEKITNVLPDWKTIKQIWPNILSGGLIGTFIGAIPGAGGDIAVFVSYGASKSASKHPELYGTGIPNGVAATESANNGCSGGAMIPLLSLGVPGDSVTAILLGAFIMKGITPGPMMYVTELPTVYRVFAALMLANLCMLVVGCLGVRFFAKIVSVEQKMLYPIILVISLLGAFSINKNAFDVGVCVAFGIIGWLMNKYEFPLSPILLALILGPMCEKNFVRYMNIQRGNFFAITTSPIAMVFATVAILVIVYSVYNQQACCCKRCTGEGISSTS